MSEFDFLICSQPKPNKKNATPNKVKRGNADVIRRGLVVRVVDRSVLFFDDESGQEFFIPKSTIVDWWFTVSGNKSNLRLDDLQLDDEITVVFPRWLARKEGIA